MSTETKETHEIEDKGTYCFACGNELRSFSILICAECLDDECGEFMKMAETAESEK